VPSLRRSGARSSVAWSPIGLLFTISAIVFGAETLVMLFLLPAVVPDENSLPASIIDAAIMVTLSAPFLWWLIARQHHAKEVLSESEQRFRKIFQEGPLGMALVGLDYRPVKVNAALCDMLGYSADELTSVTFPEFTHPDDADADVQLAGRLLHGEISFYRMDKRYLTKAGDAIWTTLTASIIRDDRGRALYYLGMVENISDRKQMEEALRAREEQTRLIIETAHDSFVGMDTEGLITAWNRQAEKTFGWSREEALGRPLSELIIPPRLQAAHREGLRRFLATGETRLLDRPLENVAIHRDGQEFPVELAVWAVGPSESCTFNAFIRDITARKLAEQNLVKLTEELEASHNTLETLNQTLEEKVRERTQKLQAREQDLILSNEELKQRNCQLLEAAPRLPRTHLPHCPITGPSRSASAPKSAASQLTAPASASSCWTSTVLRASTTRRATRLGMTSCAAVPKSSSKRSGRIAPTATEATSSLSFSPAPMSGKPPTWPSGFDVPWRLRSAATARALP
jgi:PAS domain S-box-containing protein